MECKNCNKEMELDEYYTYFLDNDEKVSLCERFWCPHCEATAIKYTYYNKESEETVYGR